jgi:hypothetical protein
MPYEMHNLTDRVRVGQNKRGDFNIEVYTPHRDHPEAELAEIFILKMPLAN